MREAINNMADIGLTILGGILAGIVFAFLMLIYKFILSVWRDK